QAPPGPLVRSIDPERPGDVHAEDRTPVERHEGQQTLCAQRQAHDPAIAAELECIQQRNGRPLPRKRFPGPYALARDWAHSLGSLVFARSQYRRYEMEEGKEGRPIGGSRYLLRE